MLNIEKYRDEILEIGWFFGKKKGKLYHCNNMKCKDCDFSKAGGCRNKTSDWLRSEYIEKPILTEQEWHFCMAVQTGWIARDKSGILFFYDKKPEKYNIFWNLNDGRIYSVPSNLCFDFIKFTDAEPWAVEDLLKLEVRKDEKA